MWWKFPWNEPRLTFWAHCHKTPQKNKFILVVSDYFAKWTERCPIPDQEATTVTKKLVSNSINLLFWCTLQLHSNQRTNFELKVFDEVCRSSEIEKTCTTLRTGWAFSWDLHWNVTWEDPAIPETGSKHDLAKCHLNKAAEQQKWNYDKWLAGRTFVIGDSACLHYVQRKKERNAKLACLSEWPYIVISVLSNGAYRSRKAERSFIQTD